MGAIGVGDVGCDFVIDVVGVNSPGLLLELFERGAVLEVSELRSRSRNIRSCRLSRTSFAPTCESAGDDTYRVRGHGWCQFFSYMVNIDTLTSSASILIHISTPRDPDGLRISFVKIPIYPRSILVLGDVKWLVEHSVRLFDF